MTPSDHVAAAASLCEIFQATAARHPDEIALRSSDGGLEVTWRQYAERVRSIATGLASLGVGRGDTVAIMLTNRPEFNLVDAAVMHLGAVGFSIYNTFPPDQIAHLFASAGNRIVVCEEQFLDKIRAAAAETGVDSVVCIDGAANGIVGLDDLESRAVPGFDFDATWRAVSRDDLLTLIFTSGTTGAPKGVELTHGNILFSVATNVALQAENSRGEQRPSVISYLPDANLANRWSAHYVPMASGATITTVRDGKTVIQVLARVHPTAFMGVPMIWYKLKAQIEQSLDGKSAFGRRATATALGLGAAMARAEVAGTVPSVPLRAAHVVADRLVLGPLRAEFGLDNFWVTTSGGAPISPEALQFYMALGVPLCEVWGMTEVAASGLGNSPGTRRPGTVGKVRNGIEIRLAEDGELLFRSPGVMRGYRNDPEKTAEAIDAQGWLHTGDVATIDADGYVRIVDRKKDMIINSSGKNMSPANIENTVKMECPLIGTIVAIGDARPHVTALIVLDPEEARAFATAGGADADPETLSRDPRVRAAVEEGVAKGNSRLSRVEQVREFAILPTFWEANSDELTATTKVRRKVVHEKYAATIDALYAPRQDTAGGDVRRRSGAAESARF
ncbi:AMP-dependent synthetase/ligase [Prescottella equi]|uniref:AMP-dependent synthetase/ligase n=1 Tax=Rhodococcus hoagii TaxID=43767 RepID=UPI00384E272A